MTDGPYVNYDYAWKTPGWSAQNPTINYGTDGYITPGLPSDVSVVRLYGSFMELNSGRPLEGVLRLRVGKILVYTPTNQQVLGGLLPVIRFNKGGFSVYLPATDDPQLVSADGQPWRYEAELTVRGVKQKFEFTLPADTPEVNVSVVQNMTTPPDSVLVGTGTPTETVQPGVDYVDEASGDLYTWEA